MGAVVAAGRRALPRGYADFGLQLAIWFGFYLVYQLVRGAAGDDAAAALANGVKVMDFERRLGALFELSVQGFAASSQTLIHLTAWTYWLSQFAVLGIALLWVYLRRNEWFLRFRNTILLANTLGLVGYFLLPTAPPRMFPHLGFVDTLQVFSLIDHSSAAVEFSSNPYAAMPSLHSADALIVGVVMAAIVRRAHWKALWLAWPAWVWFTVIATGNHFWLDVVAGAAVASAAGLIVFRGPRLRPQPRRA
ncbi:MAG TPA: phosphatase PAP2 family protein [Gaiellaceae bacterium]|nr:phosphatase PAP2 family protein [Gaiellaceae bacterium]